MQHLETPYGNYSLQRIPADPTHTLRAWDAADEYLLEHLNAKFPALTNPLILNDNFGALGVSLHHTNPVLMTDSCVSKMAIKQNRMENDIGGASAILDSLAPLPEGSPVLIKLPKTAAYFEYQLQLLNHYLPAGTPVLIGAMVKYLSKVFFGLIDQHLENMHTSLAQKKARLVFATIKGNGNPPELLSYLPAPEYGLELCNTPNVFASGKIDIGSRFFIDNLPPLPMHAAQVIDLGCGNGLLGVHAMKKNPKLGVTFVDESWHAIHAARASVATNCPANSNARYQVNHCLSGFESNNADLIFCNPPFHQQQATGTEIARIMFRDSARVLSPGGSLYVIGNRHLGYHQELKRYFRKVMTIASNRKFVMFSATC